ncbi:type II secretion system F family protein [Candidatus Dependentiae bacterium]|nr:MAG: type II secretion system F family protein [Candidatus Dependentiae bacterium]
MPYFWWEGITITGNLISGYSFAPTDNYLANQLFKQQIALTKTKDYSFLTSFYTINLMEQVDFYEQLATLLHNGIQLAPAFILLAQQNTNPIIQEILFYCGAEIEAGVNIKDILIKHERFFDTLARQTISIGLETGNLVAICTILSSHYKDKAFFKNKMRTVLLTPKITAVAILIVGLLLFIFFIPKLNSLFVTLNVPLSRSTQILMNISTFVRSTPFLYITGTLFFLISMITILKNKSCYLQNSLASCYYRIPFVRSIMTAWDQTTFFSFLTILLKSNITLPEALTIIEESLPKGKLQTTVKNLHEQVQAGQTLATAMTSHSLFFDTYQIAIIGIAQETASLPTAIQNIAQKTAAKIDTMIGRIMFWIGPILLLLLGFSIAILMLTIFSPLMELSAGLH